MAVLVVCVFWVSGEAKHTEAVGTFLFEPLVSFSQITRQS